MNFYNSCDNKYRNVSLVIYKINSVTEVGIPGAVFELTACNARDGCNACNGSTSIGTTDSNGLSIFYIEPCNTYMLREIDPPVGYAPTDHVFNIHVDACDCIFVDGVLTSQLIIRNTPLLAAFTAIKVNIIDGAPLPGATYILFLNSLEIASTVSNATGQVSFTNLSPGTYELVETIPPPGFQTNAERLTVVVAQDGSVTIMDQPANGFILNDVPLSEFIFRKLDSSTGSPLAGATFVLTQNGTIVATVTSGSDGLVNFDVLAAGTYQLTESVTLPGYQPNSTIYQVVVRADGSITVNGVALDGFVVENIPIAVSAPPSINNIFEGALVISGIGVPGSTIEVTLPNGSTIITTVAATDAWLVNVPAGVELIGGDIVSAVQTESGKLPSSEVSVVVIAFIEPLLEKTAENITLPGEAARPGDVLQYQILVGNLGGIGSVWSNATLTDLISEDLTFIPGTVTLNGQLISAGTGVGQYIYDSVSHTLTIRVGDLVSGEIKEVTFQVTVNLDAAGAEITNTVSAGNMLAFGFEPIKTASSPTLIVAG